jgi:hypothetical protein
MSGPEELTSIMMTQLASGNNMLQKFLVITLLLVFVLFSGCTQTAPEPVPEEEITTEVPTTLPTVTTQTVKPTATVTKTRIPVTTIAPIVTVEITPDPADVSLIQFARYSDSDFTLYYPVSWNVSKTTYTSYFCTATATTKCYQDELRTIGPFDFKEYSIFKKPSRIVIFTSADRKLKIVVLTNDFLDGLNGNYEIDPTLDWARNRVTMNYPDVPGTAVGDYQYAMSEGTKISSHRVTMPEGTSAYPMAYIMKNYVTMHHDYEFAFISDNENIQKYNNLKDRILASIKTND